jgi:hypothetical protein
MSPVRALVVDFDGTACLQDVSEELLEAFGEPNWPEFDDAVDRGEMGLREAAEHQAAMLSGSREEMLAHALEHAELDPTFPPFVAWAEARGLPLTLVSDGFAFYIRRSSRRGRAPGGRDERAGVRGGCSELRHPNGHPVHRLRTQDARGPAASGEQAGRVRRRGQPSATGALRGRRVHKLSSSHSRADGVPFLRWRRSTTRVRALETLERLPGAVAPVACPGWIPASASRRPDPAPATARTSPRS